MESPSKSKTIEKYLGNDYKVVSSLGHIRDLSTSGKYGFGVDIEDDFIVYLTGWSEGTGHSMISIYNDMTAKDRTWKNLDKLKNALEQDDSNNN